MHKYWAFMNWLDSDKVLNNIQGFFITLISCLILILILRLLFYDFFELLERRKDEKENL